MRRLEWCSTRRTASAINSSCDGHYSPSLSGRVAQDGNSYGALMWSLGKVIASPEVCRVYIGSFWDQVDKSSENYPLIEAEQRDLIRDLLDLPRNTAVRKINELVKRARLAKVHAYIIGHLKSEMPALFGKSAKQAALLENLAGEFKKIQRESNLASGDFPNPAVFRERLEALGLKHLNKLDKKLIANMDEVLAQDIPRLMQQFPLSQKVIAEAERFFFIKLLKLTKQTMVAHAKK